MENSIINESKQFVKSAIKKHVGPEFTYHNIKHTENVVAATELLAAEANLSKEDSELLILGAIYHDVGYCWDVSNHEIKSAEIAGDQLSTLGLSHDKIEKIKNLILSTKMSWVGTDKLSLLLRDADMSGLACTNYIEKAEGLRLEKSYFQDEAIPQEDWLKSNIKFLTLHKYNSDEGKKLFKKKKKRNLKLLKKMRENQSAEYLTIASSKSAQTQLKTALRNHIDLSAIADNKANIMLSVNAVIITVGIPLLIDTINTHPMLLIPTIILGLTSVVSMIFATLSTRPQRMGGKTDINLIAEKETNLFFFGNYYKMDFSKYEKGMKEVVGDNEIMDNSITRDLFYLGKSLGKKYDYLRLCYNVFMIGVVAAVVAFGIILLVSQL